MSLNSIKRLILLLWASYFTIIVTSNLADALKEAGLFSPDWPYASGNFGFIQKVIAIYSLPDLFAWGVYGVIILLELSIMILFWKAASKWKGLGSSSERWITNPFGMAILLWTIFILADEFFIVSERLPGLEGIHFTGLITQVITLMLLLVQPHVPATMKETSTL